MQLMLCLQMVAMEVRAVTLRALETLATEEVEATEVASFAFTWMLTIRCLHQVPLAGLDWLGAEDLVQRVERAALWELAC